MLRRNSLSTDRVQILYINQQGKEIRPPLSHYLTNRIFPEKRICKFCLYKTRYIPQKWIPRLFRETILQYYYQDVESGRIKHFADAYKTLEKNGYMPMSGAITQVWNHIYSFLRIKKRFVSAYLIQPMNYDTSKKYSLVVFCHGNAGNWLLYQGIWMGLNDCFVLSIGTVGLSGSFKKNQIDAIFSFWIPLLLRRGYTINDREIHIMGLSAGGSAVRIAKSYYPQFASLTFINTQVSTYGYLTKTNIVGGGKDIACTNNLASYSYLKDKCNLNLLWFPEEHHFLIVNQTQKVLDFLNRNISGI